MAKRVAPRHSAGSYWSRLWIIGLGAALGVMALAYGVGAVTLGGTTITLTSATYNVKSNYTRFTYQVTTNSHSPIPAYWVLGVGDCVTDEDVVPFCGSSFTWVTSPFRGMKFAVSSRNQKSYVCLSGQWTEAETQVAAAWTGGSGTLLTGSIDGPACAAASISLDVLQGDSVSFPAVEGAGTYPASTETVLRVTSSTSGWTLGYALAFSIPSGATQTVVEDIFHVTLADYTASSGITDVGVSYALVVDLEDFAGLPQGTYVITIAYTVSTD
ncbi:MAG: hypothetical protein NTY63_09420 [Candidatus Bipolaricaulota bacterium]|nr:hypothetical protein [Candidatus Bipolaricaulota bacterium]